MPPRRQRETDPLSNAPAIEDWEAGAPSDYDWAFDAISRITDDGASIDALSPSARGRCEVLVDYYWPEIAAVVSEIQRCERRSGPEVDAIVNNSTAARGAARPEW